MGLSLLAQPLEGFQIPFKAIMMRLPGGRDWGQIKA